MEHLNKKRVLKNTIFLYIKTIISTLVTFFSTRLVLQALGAEDYGVYGIVGGVIAMLGYLNIAMASATQRYLNIAEGAGDLDKSTSIFNNTVILHFFIGIIVVVVLESIFYIMFNGVLNIPPNRIEAAKVIYHFMVVSTFFTIITVPYEALINSHENFLYYSIVGIIESLLRLSAAFTIIYYMGDKLILYGLLLALISIAMMVVMRIYCKLKYKECKLEIKRYANKSVIKDIGAFAGWNFIGVFASIAGNFGSTILMNHFFGTIVIAAKNIGDQIGGQLSILTSNLTKSITPAIMKSEGGGERGQMINLSFLACRYGYLLYSLFAIPFLFKTEFLLSVWLKDIPEWAVLFCQLQVIRTLTEQLFSPLKTMLMAEGSIKKLNIANLILGIVTFVVLLFLYYIGLPSYWHYIVSILLMVFVEAVIKIYYCKVYCNISYKEFIGNVVHKSVLVTIISCAVLYAMNLIGIDGWYNLMIVVLMVIATSVVTILCGLNTNEKKMIANFIRKK